MRSTLVIWFLLLPSLTIAQSLGELAKKERERRDKNKEQGKSAIEISENDLYPEGRPAPETEGAESASTGESARAPAASTAEYTEEELRDGEEDNVPTFISPDAPLEERLETFQRMRRHYENQVREIDEKIAENEKKLRELQAEMGATSAAGGAGLPVPQTGAEAPNRQMTGQESQTLIAEQDRLQEMNQQLAAQKEKLKFDLQQKGHAAGIPAGYLRF